LRRLDTVQAAPPLKIHLNRSGWNTGINVRRTVHRLSSAMKPSGFHVLRLGGRMGHARPHPPPLRQSTSGHLARLFGDDGTIGERAGVPVDFDQWHWSCGSYRGLHPGSIAMVLGRHSTRLAPALRRTGTIFCPRYPKTPLRGTAANGSGERR
jgi:hypothetical protein